MPDAYFIAARRTPIGRLNGALRQVRPDDLATVALTAALSAVEDLDPLEIDDVYWGAANQAGEDNRNVARMAVLLAGLPFEVPGATVNRLCASGLEAITGAARAIRAGEAELVIAGGSESMSRAPFAVGRPEAAYPASLELVETRLGWRFVNPGHHERHEVLAMAETAERVAREKGVSRERQDEFALRSHRRAEAARASGRFAREIVAIPTADGTPVSEDEGIRPDTSLGRLAGLRPLYEEGTVTAGNASPLNDGAAAVVLASESWLERHPAVAPIARYVAGASAGVDPDLMGLGPIPATRKVLARAGWSVEDLDAVELNEAFASQAIACAEELGIPDEVLNVNGGAIALGHPLGCSGARLVTTLLHEESFRGAAGRRALATMCVGVGQGTAVLVESA
ncbi:MAG: thiolase family protein [Solirubrobacterales bacterium]